MASKTFTPGVVIDSPWLNDVNDTVYDILGNGTTVPATKSDARTNLGLGTIATQAANNVAITGGAVSGVALSGLANDLAIADGGTGASTSSGAFANLSAGVALSFRNKLINALGTINQRAYISGAAAVAALSYTVDRWRVVVSGQALSWALSGIANVMTAPAGGVEQVIEGNNIEGGVYTLSWVGTATATVNGAAVTNGGQTASLTAGANVIVRFIGGTFSLPQFEKGPIATGFEYRHHTIELMLCQRYFYRRVGSGMWGTGFANATNNAVGITQHPVEMRIGPVATANAIAIFNGATFGASSFSSGASNTFFTTLNLGFGGAPLAANQGLFVQGASAGAFLTVDAEIV